MILIDSQPVAITMATGCLKVSVSAAEQRSAAPCWTTAISTTEYQPCLAAQQQTQILAIMGQHGSVLFIDIFHCVSLQLCSVVWRPSGHGEGMCCPHSNEKRDIHLWRISGRMLMDKMRGAKVEP